VSRLKLDSSGAGVKVAGVIMEPASYADNDRQRVQYYAATVREVVLCSGAIANPQLLMLRYGHHVILLENICSRCCPFSGIGPREHLQKLGVMVAKDLAGVGSNLVSRVICAAAVGSN
jgi:choline dehydrogenase